MTPDMLKTLTKIDQNSNITLQEIVHDCHTILSMKYDADETLKT